MRAAIPATKMTPMMVRCHHGQDRGPPLPHPRGHHEGTRPPSPRRARKATNATTTRHASSTPSRPPPPPYRAPRSRLLRDSSSVTCPPLLFPITTILHRTTTPPNGRKDFIATRNSFSLFISCGAGLHLVISSRHLIFFVSFYKSSSSSDSAFEKGVL